MAAITEEALQGEWFYLEDEQPVYRNGASFYVIRSGKMKTGTGAEVATYSIEGRRAVIRFHRTTPMTTVLTLSSMDPVFDKTTGTLSSSAIYTLPDGSDPYHMYGSFVRRIAELSSTDNVGRCAG